MNPQLLSQRALSTLIKSLLISLFVCSMLWCAGSQTTVLAQTEPTVPLMQNMTKLWHWGGVISTMTPVSDTLYVGMGQDLVIFDIADPTSPKLLGQLSLDAWVYDLEIVGTHALIAADSKGLLIVDVSDKQARAGWQNATIRTRLTVLRWLGLMLMWLTRVLQTQQL